MISWMPGDLSNQRCRIVRITDDSSNRRLKIAQLTSVH